MSCFLAMDAANKAGWQAGRTGGEEKTSVAILPALSGGAPSLARVGNAEKGKIGLWRRDNCPRTGQGRERQKA